MYKLVLRPETMHKACGQDNIASASTQTHDAMKTLKLKVVITYMNFELFCGSWSNSMIQFSPYSSNTAQTNSSLALNILIMSKF